MAQGILGHRVSWQKSGAENLAQVVRASAQAGMARTESGEGRGMEQRLIRADWVCTPPALVEYFVVEEKQLGHLVVSSSAYIVRATNCKQAWTYISFAFTIQLF